MRQARILGIVVAALLIVLVGCSQEGTLTIQNDTNGWVDIFIDGDYKDWIEPHDDMTLEYEFPGFLLNLIQRETVEFELGYRGFLLLDGAEDVEIEAGDDQDVDLNSNTGTIQVVNNSSFTINEVYISQDNMNWGDPVGIPGGQILPGEGVFWWVQPGNYYVRVADNNPSIQVSNTNPHVDVDQWLTWEHLNGGFNYGSTAVPAANVQPAAAPEYGVVEHR